MPEDLSFLPDQPKGRQELSWLPDPPKKGLIKQTLESPYVKAILPTAKELAISQVPGLRFVKPEEREKLSSGC